MMYKTMLLEGSKDREGKEPARGHTAGWCRYNSVLSSLFISARGLPHLPAPGRFQDPKKETEEEHPPASSLLQI